MKLKRLSLATHMHLVKVSNLFMIHNCPQITQMTAD